MLGGRAYPSSYRHRRSFLKHFLVLFIIFAFVIWQTRQLSSRNAQDLDADLSLAKPPLKLSPGHSEVSIEARQETPDSPNVVDTFTHHVHHHQTAIEAIPEPEPKPEQVTIPAQNERKPVRIVDIQRLNDYDDSSDEHNVDDVERIKDSIGDKVDQETKLIHPEDDDESIPDTDYPKFQDGVLDQHVNAQQKSIQDQVDELLKADHPSKEDEETFQEEETDVEELPVADEHFEQRIEALHEQTPWTEKYKFPTWEECESLKDKADSLPDMIHVTFEESVKDVRLDGWEDEWISKARYTGPKLQEPKMDFVYTWVNGSQPEFKESMRPYEINSTLNDEDGKWIESHSTNRYREWNELRYSMRSVEKYAGDFTNRIQILVNAFQNTRVDNSQPITYGKQRPHWLRDDNKKVQVLSQEEFFGPEEKKCLPTFDSLTIENQLYNTKSEVDRLIALSDDMLLGKPHSASDLYSPLFGPTMGFKDNAYNTLKPPTEEDAERFGEKPFLIYTSWLLNRRFGARKRKGQAHFIHSLSRSITKEAITSFPRPALRSALQRFRGETGFQLYSWYVIFHYTMERHREALLWSYIMLRSDADEDGYLSWNERKKILRELGEGMNNETPELFRHRVYYHVGDHHEKAGLQPPKVNTEVLWTSLDGPAMIKDLDCDAFDTEDCLAPGFSMDSSDSAARSPVFSSAAIFDRISRQSPRCGDCLLKLILNRRRAGLGPLLPHPVKQQNQREIVIKALMKYQYTIVKPDAEFYMVTDAEQAEQALLKPYIKKSKKVGQMCLNDDVVTSDPDELNHLGKVMDALFKGLLPEPSSFEM